MKIINAKNKTFSIENINELKDVILKLKGGRKKPIDIEINHPHTEKEINDYLATHIGEIYADNKEIMEEFVPKKTNSE